MIESVLKLGDQIVCYLLIAAAECLDFPVWALFLSEDNVDPESVDFGINDEFTIVVQDFFFKSGTGVL